MTHSPHWLWHFVNVRGLPRFHFHCGNKYPNEKKQTLLIQPPSCDKELNYPIVEWGSSTLKKIKEASGMPWEIRNQWSASVGADPDTEGTEARNPLVQPVTGEVSPWGGVACGRRLFPLAQEPIRRRWELWFGMSPGRQQLGWVPGHWEGWDGHQPHLPSVSYGSPAMQWPSYFTTISLSLSCW